MDKKIMKKKILFIIPLLSLTLLGNGCINIQIGGNDEKPTPINQPAQVDNTKTEETKDNQASTTKQPTTKQ